MWNLPVNSILLYQEKLMTLQKIQDLLTILIGRWLVNQDETELPFRTRWTKEWRSIWETRKIYWGVKIQFSSVAQSCPTLCDPMNHSMPGLPVYHQLPEFTQTHIHWVSDAIQPSHPLSSPSPPAPNPFQHQSLVQWVNSSHEVAKVLEFQL